MGTKNRCDSVGIRYGQLGGANGIGANGMGGANDMNSNVVQTGMSPADSGFQGNMEGTTRRTFDINNTDPADDVPQIAQNYQTDRYNYQYSGLNEWDVLDPGIKGVQVPRNPSASASPDRIISAAEPVSPITQQRTVIDKLWQRPVSADVDTYNIQQRMAVQDADKFGGVGTPGGVTQRAAQMLPAPQPGTPAFTGDIDNNVENLAGVDAIGQGGLLDPAMTGATATGAPSIQCQGKDCMDMLDKIMNCEECMKKLKKLLGANDESLFGFGMPEINLSKLMFWIIVIILIVAVYELLNTLMSRLFARPAMPSGFGSF
jgi:hypothetical protein